MVPVTAKPLTVDWLTEARNRRTIVPAANAVTGCGRSTRCPPGPLGRTVVCPADDSIHELVSRESLYCHTPAALGLRFHYSFLLSTGS